MTNVNIRILHTFSHPYSIFVVWDLFPSILSTYSKTFYLKPVCISKKKKGNICSKFDWPNFVGA